MQSSTVRPNLFLVGAPKCGTTSLYEYLRQHPQIFFPAAREANSNWRVKEPAFFCPELLPPDIVIRDEQQYLANYAGSEQYRWRGDATTYYLYSKDAPARIKGYSPDARVLVILRPPVEQMRSNHAHLLRAGREDIADFHAAVAATDDRRRGRRMPARGVQAWLDYTGVCSFAQQVERYLATFGKDRVKVVLLEDLRARPAETYRDVLAFLEVDANFLPEFRVHNEAPPRGVLERFVTDIYQKPAVKQAASTLFPYKMRRRLVSGLRKLDAGGDKSDPRDLSLRAVLRPGVERLAGLIGRDLSHWM
ncbi:MAG TPA: sulfotransferase [Rhodanobacteraceae bacterium]|nr:sulfotransferase [Rhodanobacteraceae bacterium]